MNHALETDARNTPSWSLALPIVGVVIAIVATTTMDAAGALQLQRVRSAAIDALVLVPRAPLPFGNAIQLRQPAPLHSRPALSTNGNWADRHRGALCREYRSLENELAESIFESFDRHDFDWPGCDRQRGRIFQRMAVGITPA